jgi:hypothetical protein
MERGDNSPVKLEFNDIENCVLLWGLQLDSYETSITSFSSGEAHA